MKRLFLILLLVSPSCFAAITEHYVSSSGASSWPCTSAGTPCSLTTAFANATAGDRVNIKADGTYTRAATDTPANAGTVTSPVIWRGYSTTIGDGNLGRTNGNGALITTNMPLIAYNSTFKFAPNTFTIIESLNVTTTFAGAAITLQTDTMVKSCRVFNASTGASPVGIGLNSTAPNCTVLDCDIEMTGSSTSYAVNMPGVAQRTIGCRIKGGTGGGIQFSASSGAIAIGNVIIGCGGFGIGLTATTVRATIYGNTIVGGTVEGINVITGLAGTPGIINNMITDNTTYGIEYVSTSNPVQAAYNRYRDNTTANTHNSGDWLTATGYGDITSGNGTSDYVASGSQDYRLISTSPAKAAGATKYQDIGAFQRREPQAGFFLP